ncbi:MAG: hypothetical protein ACYTDT_10050, partial [Planctomycetota bacterium]
SIFIGIILLVGLITLLSFASFGSALAPTLFAIFDPTVGEGIFFGASITITCALYCTYLFLNTTNRLKSTAHNKSTNLRIFWTVAAIVIPLQGLGYFLICRIHSHSSVTFGVILLALYVGLMLLVPSLSAPSEAVIPSRRVRREMDRLPKAFTGAGGSLFFPGSFRGVVHSALVTIVAAVLIIATAWFAYGQLDARNEDAASLRADYNSIVNQDQDIRTRMMGSLIPTSFAPPEEMKATVEKYTAGEWQGFLLLVATIIAVVLASAQFSWRVSLSGLSKNLATVIGGLLLCLWVVAPYIVQMIADSASNSYSDSISMFSPIQGLLNSTEYGEQIGYQAQSSAPVTSDLAPGQAVYMKWVWFMVSAGVIWLGLLAWNLTSFRQVKANIAKLTGEGGTPQALPTNVAPEAPAVPAAEPPVATAAPVAQPEPLAVSEPQPEPELPKLSDIETISDVPPEDAQ